jgi:DTW domain-containing protein YfiP
LTSLEPREVCARCRRPTTVCYCATLPRLETRTRVVILQHPREREHPIGTARMASLCLPQVSIHVGMQWTDSAALARTMSDPARPPVLLYPGEGARDILRDPPAGPVTLIVVDGTWSQARRVVRDNPVLQALPRYAFEAPEPTQYRIRKEPRVEYVSTIEALMHVLGALEGEPARFRALLEPFRAMIDAHLARRAVTPNNRIRVVRPPRPPRFALPPEIHARFEDLVAVCGEANAWPYHADERGLGDEMVHWVARRVATGETFEMIAAPVRPLAPSTPFHTGLDEATLRGGGTHDELLAGFARFLRPTDVVCSWGPYSPRLYEATGGTLPEARIDVRAAAQKLTSKKLGSVEAYASRIAPPPSQPLPAGRAGSRLGMVTSILHAWRALVVESAP